MHNRKEKKSRNKETIGQERDKKEKMGISQEEKKSGFIATNYQSFK